MFHHTVAPRPLGRVQGPVTGEKQGARLKVVARHHRCDSQKVCQPFFRERFVNRQESGSELDRRDLGGRRIRDSIVEGPQPAGITRVISLLMATEPP